VSTRGRAAAGRAALRLLLPASERIWVEALWAESLALPEGRERARWQAGAVVLVAREALRGWRTPGRIAFLVTAGLAAFACWPGSPASTATAIDRADVIAAVVMLAGLTLLARRCLGPASSGWLARTIRVGGYAAILILISVKAAAERYCYQVAQTHPWFRRYWVVAGLPSGVGHWLVEAIYLLVLGCCMLVVLWATSAGTRFARGSLTLAVGLGLTIGVGLYLSAPLGPWQSVNPWLPRPWPTAIGYVDWALLLAGPVLLGPVATRRSPAPGGTESLTDRRFIQCVALGMLAAVIAVLVQTVGADTTIAAALQSPGAANWLNHGQDLTGTAAYLRNLNAGESEFEYVLLDVGILVACFVASLVAAVVVLAAAREAPPPGGGGHGDGGRGDGGRGDGGPPRGEVPPVLSPPQPGLVPEAPSRQPVLTG
jgi:hypothetical protein